MHLQSSRDATVSEKRFRLCAEGPEAEQRNRDRIERAVKMGLNLQR
jgi:hypothetical protein